MLFKFKKDRSLCPVVMNVKSHGIVINEIGCTLPVNHDGPHRGSGLVWANSEAMIRKWAEAAEKPNRPKIFLAK
jgi:hypothetical protein